MCVCVCVCVCVKGKGWMVEGGVCVGNLPRSWRWTLSVCMYVARIRKYFINSIFPLL